MRATIPSCAERARYAPDVVPHRLSIAVAMLSIACAPSPQPPAQQAPPRPERPPHSVQARETERAAAAEVRAAAPSREGWNDAQIDWVTYEEGLARARAEDRPALLVLHADWCVHCRNYSHVFEDPRIVERARSLVMIRIDVDAHRALAGRYVIDGGYVPRTFVLAPDGTTRADIDARRERFRYFYDEHDPSSLLAAMDAALGR